MTPSSLTDLLPVPLLVSPFSCWGGRAQLSRCVPFPRRCLLHTSVPGGRSGPITRARLLPHQNQTDHFFQKILGCENKAK